MVVLVILRHFLLKKETSCIFKTDMNLTDSDSSSSSISWSKFVNLTFYLHFGEETDPISHFNNNNVRIMETMLMALKK